MVSMKKLCWSCEGEVHNKATQCPYCGAELIAASAVVIQEEETVPPYPYAEGSQDVSSHIPEPPYAPSVNSSIENPFALPEQQQCDESTSQESTDSVEMSSDSVKKQVTPLFLLSLGVVFFLFSFILLLFSRDGIFSLQWNAHRWWGYLFLSAPCLFIGWKALNNIKE